MHTAYSLPPHPACNLAFIFDEHLTFLTKHQICPVSNSGCSHICEVCYVHPYFELKTARRPTVFASVFYSKLDYCNLRHYTLPSFHINRLQHIQNSRAHGVKIPKFFILFIYHVSPILTSLHWLNINERIQYTILSLS